MLKIFYNILKLNLRVFLFIKKLNKCKKLNYRFLNLLSIVVNMILCHVKMTQFFILIVSADVLNVRAVAFPVRILFVIYLISANYPFKKYIIRVRYSSHKKKRKQNSSHDQNIRNFHKCLVCQFISNSFIKENFTKNDFKRKKPSYTVRA